MKELVNHPSHYNIPGKKECIVMMEEEFGIEYTAIFCLTSAYKYLYRKGEKDGNSEEQDMNKVRWYFNYTKKLLNKIEHKTSIYTNNNFLKLYRFVEKSILEGDNI